MVLFYLVIILTINIYILYYKIITLLAFCKIQIFEIKIKKFFSLLF